MNAFRLYCRFAGIAIRSQLQYTASSIMLALSQFIMIGLEFVGIWALFERFSTLRGWTLAEIAALYGLMNLSFSSAEVFGRGFDCFPGLVKRGDFDRVLLRPRSLALQVAAMDIPFHRLGRFMVGLVTLLWAAHTLDVCWTLPRLGLLLFAIFGGACLFFGLFVFQATLAFWTVETLEIMNAVTYGGTEAGQYPLTIYRPWFRKFFTYVIPLAAVSYYPALAIFGRADTVTDAPLWFQCCAPAIGIAFLGVSFVAWRFGVRHYCSTGS